MEYYGPRIAGTMLFGTMWLASFLMFVALHYHDMEMQIAFGREISEKRKLIRMATGSCVSFAITFPAFVWVMYQIWLTDNILPPS